jgi:predicted phage terminase large subunit-like protein
MNFTSAIRAFRTISAKYPKARRKLVEEAANGAALIDTLKNEIEGIIPIRPSSSKEARLMDASVLFEAGNVYFPDPSIAPWIHDNVEEMCGFPNAEHDDTVDCATQYINDSKQNQSAMNRLSRLITM